MLFPFHLILYLGASALIWITVKAYPRQSHERYFEERYINTRNYKLHNETIKLIGYKKLKIPLEEVDEFEHHYFTNYDELQKFDSHFYDQASMELRIYFPVAGALIVHQGSMIEANELGEFEIEDVEDCVVLGRKQTDHVRGVYGNIIKDGIIYLADKAHPTHQIGKVFVYDFGFKTLDHYHDRTHSKRADTTHKDNKGCVANHGGENCSDKYNIHQGRCPENHKTCMDYNGFITDCHKETNLSKKKMTNFIGSDCSIAVSKGNCYNELPIYPNGN